MSEGKTNVPWPVWALVTIAVAFIPAYFAYKGALEKSESNKVQENITRPEKKVIDNEEVSAVAQPGNADEDIAQKIIGTWHGSYSQSGYNYAATVTYNVDGGFTGKTDVANQTGMLGTIYYSGNWNISEKYNTLTVTNSNNPQFLPVGTVSISKIESINDKRCVFVDDQGIRRTSEKLN